MNRKALTAKLFNLQSALETSTGWYPAGPHLNSNRMSSVGTGKSSVRSSATVSRSSSATRLTAWSNGTLLSELLAGVLVEDRTLVKEVDQFDDFGRLSQSPKLLLVGTELTVKSKAQAVHNFRVCLDALEKIPHFPRTSFYAEELIADEVALQAVFDRICACYSLPPIRTGDDLPMVLLARRRQLARRLPSRRSSSAPPALLRMHMDSVQHKRSRADSTERSRSKSPQRVRSQLDERSKSPPPRARKLDIQPLQRRGDTPQRLQAAARQGRSRARSCSPTISRSIVWAEQVIQDSPVVKYSPNRRAPTAASSSSILAQRSSASSQPKPSLKPQDSLRERVKLLEMKKERLQVQRRDRVGRRQSQLMQQLRREYNADIVEKPAVGKSMVSVTKSTLPVSRGYTDTLPGARPSSGTTVPPLPEAAAQQPSSSYGQLHAPPSSTFTQKKTTEGQWQPPFPSDREVEAARRVVLPPIGAAQQSAIRDWLLTLHFSILEGEGGYYQHSYIFTEGSVSQLLPAGAGGPTPLPLNKDRLRNGVLWLDLLTVLECDACQHLNIQKFMHRNPLSIQQALENLNKAMWVLLLRLCPPIPKHLLVRQQDIVKGDKAVIWSLLYEIMQTRGGRNASGAHHAGHVSGALVPEPINAGYYRGGLHSSRDSRDSQRLLGKARDCALPYSPDQRRQLDQSLLEWLEHTRTLQHLLGGLPRPATILALESYLKDGTLFCYLAQNVLRIFVSSYVAHPHTYSQCVSNILKCVEGLRAATCFASKGRPSVAKFPARFLHYGVEEEIARGGWDCILGLLEDMHLFYDMANGDVRKAEYPYYGQSPVVVVAPISIVGDVAMAVPRYPPVVGIPEPLPQRVGVGLEHMLPAVANEKAITYLTSALPIREEGYRPKLDLRHSLDGSSPESFASGPLDVEVNGSKIAARSMQSATRPDLVPSTRSWDQRYEFDVSQPPAPSPTRYSAREMTAFDPAMSLLDSGQPKSQEDPRVESTLHAKTVHPRSESRERLAKALNLCDEESDDDIEEDSVGAPASAFAPATPVATTTATATANAALQTADPQSASPPGLALLSTMYTWLQGIGVALHPPVDPVEKLSHLGHLFSDGVLLGRVVQKLERITLTGLHLSPKTSTHKRQNVRKVLEFLAQFNKRVTLRSLSCEEEVLAGDGEAVLALLESIKKAYPGHKP